MSRGGSDLRDDGRELAAVAVAYTVVVILLVAMLTGICGCTGPAPAVPADAAADGAADFHPLLWSDANAVLAEAYCQLGVRCGSFDYDFEYGSGSDALLECEQSVSDALCHGAWEGEAQCEGLYPTERDANLQACPIDSACVPCQEGDLDWVESCNLAAPWSQGA